MYQETEEKFPDPPRLERQNAIKPVYFSCEPPLLERSIAMTYMPDVYGFYPNDYKNIQKNEQNNIQIEIISLQIEKMEKQIEKMKKQIEKLKCIK